METNSKKRLAALFKTHLSPLDQSLYEDRIADLVAGLGRREPFRSNRIDAATTLPARPVIHFLVDQCRETRERIRELQRLQADFTAQFPTCTTAREKKVLILQLAEDLGASGRHLRADRRAFKRWFGHDVVLERCRRRIAAGEYHLVFLLNRLGVLTATLLQGTGDEAARERILTHLNMEKTLKPLLVYPGDERVKIETFRCMSRIIKRLPPHVREKNVAAGTNTFIYRASLDVRQQVWIQSSTFSLLSLLDHGSFFRAARRRLSSPADGDDLFVRRKIVRLLTDHMNNEEELKSLLPAITRDVSPFVRQAVPPVLIACMLHLKSETDVFLERLRHMLLSDSAPQVRAAALVAVGASTPLGQRFFTPVSALIHDHLTTEKDPFVLRVGFKICADMTDRFMEADDLSRARDFSAQQLPRIIAVHQQAADLSVRRWAASAREKMVCRTHERAAELLQRLAGVLPRIRPGRSRRVPGAWFAGIDPEMTGRVLSVLSQEEFSLGITRGITGTRLFRGDRFGFRLWRFLHEFLSASPDKRQGYSHVVGRKFSARTRAPSAIGSELTRTKVPGEPLFFDTESGWRPYLPLVDEMVSCASLRGSRRPIVLFTPEGMTHMAPPRGIFRRLTARVVLTLRFSRYADLRNRHDTDRSAPDVYVRALRKLGFTIGFTGFKDLAGNRDEDPSVSRFFALGLPFLTPDLWQRFKYYFFSAYENSLYELGLFAAVLCSFFVVRHLYLSRLVARARRHIPLVIGGWGTRGKSGVERLKAAVIEALGHGFVNKTTGCEAMFLHAVPFGKTREMFLFRPYDKATIWEHHDMICMTWKLRSKIFLWECMALTPPFVKVLQQNWTRDDVSTITNTYPDHEDIQGPAGINIPLVMTNFIPHRGVLISSEEEMKPILTESARRKKTAISYTGWLESGLLTPDILERFPHEEHPNNVALVVKMAAHLHIDPDFAVREMADRVVPDIGSLKIFPRASIRRRRLEFINGMSANERFATISNWRRTGLADHDPASRPDTLVSTLVNNRADRISRTRMFASIIVEDLNADFHFLIGSNLSGLMGYLNTAWEVYMENNRLYSGDAGTAASVRERFHRKVLQMKMPVSAPMVVQRIAAMCRGVDANLDNAEIEKTLGDTAALTALLHREKVDVDTAGAVAAHGETCYNALEAVTRIEKQIMENTAPKIVEAAFRELMTKWFRQKLIVIDNLHVTGNQIIDIICRHTPPGLLNRIMGLQNIKGPGLDYVYRWQAWEACRLAGDKLLDDRDPERFDRGFNEMSAFQEYGILCEDYVEETVTRAMSMDIAQTQRYQAGLAMIKANLHNTLDEIRKTLQQETPKNNLATRVAGFLEALLDAGDAVRRRKRANRIYRDLVHERISHDRAAIELKKLNQRQKGGWFTGK